MREVHIASADNPKIKHAVKLRQRRHREQEGLVPVEGFEELKFAVEAGAEVFCLFLCPELVKDNQRSFAEAAAPGAVPVYTVGPKLMEKISYREHPDGWLGILRFGRGSTGAGSAAPGAYGGAAGTGRAGGTASATSAGGTAGARANPPSASATSAPSVGGTANAAASAANTTASAANATASAANATASAANAASATGADSAASAANTTASAANAASATGADSAASAANVTASAANAPAPLLSVGRANPGATASIDAVNTPAPASTAARANPGATASIDAANTPAPASTAARANPGATASIDAAWEQKKGLVFILEDLEKPGNLGAILRTADAVGALVIAVSTGKAEDRGTDISNPNAVRASKGAVFTVPWAQLHNEEALAWLRAREIRILAADPAATDLHWDADLGGNVALVVGSENRGLSQFWRREADALLKLPMTGRVNSLNAATAAAIFAYEFWRQQSLAGGGPVK